MGISVGLGGDTRVGKTDIPIAGSCLTLSVLNFPSVLAKLTVKLHNVFEHYSNTLYLI